MQKYNKESAQKKIDELNLIKPSRICPLMNGKLCKTHCICYMAAQIQQHVEDRAGAPKDVYFTIAGPGCTNAMFTIERRCNNKP